MRGKNSMSVGSDLVVWLSIRVLPTLKIRRGAADKEAGAGYS